MKKLICLLILVMMISGCATFYNLEKALVDKPILNGLTQEQIVERFGVPDDTSTFYSKFGGRTEHWRYYHNSFVIGGPSGTLSITFENGIVESTSYY